MSILIDCIIIEDEKASMNLLNNHLKQFPFINITGGFNTAEDALKQIITTPPQLIFLDIELPKKSGFDFLNDLHKLDVHPGIIFTTAYDKYAIEAIKFGAFDYLLKPIDLEELTTVLDKFINTSFPHSLEEKINKLLEYFNPNNKLRLNTRQGFILISPSDILYCEADWNYTKLYKTDKSTETIMTNMGKTEQLLPSEGFVRISRSIIINRNYIQKITRKNNLVYLSNNGDLLTFKISKSKIKELDI